MVILHVGNLSNNKSSGVNDVAPKHIYYQSKHANVAMLNLKQIDDIPSGIKYFFKGNISDDIIDSLDAPYNKPDLVIFHGLYFFNYISLYKILLKENIPYIVFSHGSLTKVALKKKYIKKTISNLLFFNRFLIKAKAIQFLSIGEQQVSRFPTKAIIIPNGMDIPSVTKNYYNEESINILFIGRKEFKIKGIDLLLKAVFTKKDALIKSKVKIYLYGPEWEGSNKKIDLLLSKYRIGDIVLNLPPIYGEEKNKAYLDANVFIHTSRSEGLPTAVLEAMSYKVPVLVARGTGLYNDVKNLNCGWAADNTVKSIAEGLERIILDKELFQEFGGNAFNYIRANYEWNEIARQSINKYKILTNKGILIDE